MLPAVVAWSVGLVGLVSLAGPLPSVAPSVPGALRISLEVSEDIPVTAQPAQLEEAPAGCAQDATSFSAGGSMFEDDMNQTKTNEFSSESQLQE